jgi:hypothetical protein
VLRLIAISSDRPILSVEKELGITPLPLSAEFSPIFDPADGRLVSAGFGTMTTERERVSRRCTLESICVLITDEARRALSGDSLRARWPLRSSVGLGTSWRPR